MRSNFSALPFRCTRSRGVRCRASRSGLQTSSREAGFPHSHPGKEYRIRLVRLRWVLPKEKLLAAAVEANVRWSMHQLMETAGGKNAVKKGARLVGAIYEIRSGRVRFLS